MTKNEMRIKLNDSVAAFLANGGKITKCEPAGQKRPKKAAEAEEEFVEIEVESLPEALKKRFFPEE